jgi:class 3 adenylate cyclase
MGETRHLAAGTRLDSLRVEAFLARGPSARPEPDLPDRQSPLPAPTPPATPGEVGQSSLTHGFLFADLRDYTSYVDTHGDRAGAALLERYRELVRAAVADGHGAEIRTEGDSFYVVFDSVSAAVRCGLSIIAAAATTAADPQPVRVGVGVHAGETLETAEGYVGAAVNIAARLCAEARAGELVVSDTVRALTRTSLEVAFEPLGTRRLKGVAEPVALYRVVPRGAAAITVPARRPAARRPSRLLAASLGAVALVALAAVGAVVLIGGGRASVPSPGPSAAAIASASLRPSATPTTPKASPTPGPFPNVGEAAILAALPSTLAKTCERGGTADDASLAGFVGKNPMLYNGVNIGWDELNPGDPDAGVTCRPATGADRFYVMAFALPQGVDWGHADMHLGFLEGHYQLPYASCATAKLAHESWTGPGGSGQVACMNPSPYDGRPWVYFTFNKGRYLAFATRDDQDYAALYAWWTQLKTFLP